MSSARVLIVGPGGIGLDDVVQLAEGTAFPALDDAPEYRVLLGRGADHLARRLAAGEVVYGVTTGFGDSCETSVPDEHVAAMPINLMRFHGCGTGRILDEVEAAAVVAVRLVALARGWSGVRVEVLERLCDLLRHRLLPRIPAEGSVGASGDLTPLSYVVAALVGEREVWFKGQVAPAAEALREAGIPPLVLQPKESLALMNGTSVMVGLGCLAVARAQRLARLCAALTAMGSDVLGGNPAHFDDRIFAAKPHPGQRAVAGWIREDIEFPRPAAPARIQDRYSIRCAPHVIGVLVDALPWVRQWLEVEIVGANDNPLVDPETGEVLHGGNFYGGHACFALDSLKTAVANLADLVDRQIALVCNPDTNAGLPANLVGRTGPDRAAHHGFKAMQISASALAAEALKLTMPASVFSRSTECHNQDKVSMGTIAARDCLRIVELTETVAAIGLLTMCQAVDLRAGHNVHARARTLHAAVRGVIPMVDADRRQDRDIAAVLTLMRANALPIGALS
ncbi:aromatic amino acid ammonia-lyase [Nannocystis sp. RBIL2]|uniref:HAL/PAL/TAL family ammonia-lyase n=1 Tax=Nannocystis sp. RBIL2 TaxID=2996788 RepID=UPI00226F9743|nr:aromatic amino acid ammonia-lyase [Nannocystis sp. RBIL2]